MLSLDTEQIWGYFGPLERGPVPKPVPQCATPLRISCWPASQHAGVSATWFVVGGMALRGSWRRQRPPHGRPALAMDRQISPLAIEATAPCGIATSFVQRLRQARPLQEIGLHGGLTHLIWTDAARHTRRWPAGNWPKASRRWNRPRCGRSRFPSDASRRPIHELLPAYGIRCYRGRTVTRAFQLGPTLRGKLARLFDELRCSTPPIVWPHETLPGLWNIPSSLFLYPIGASRTRVVGLRSRVERFSRGIGGRRPPSRHLSLLPSSRESDRIPARLFHVRRHAAVLIRSSAIAAMSRF